jgi:tetratricopeptide (TPR) repeat protein
LLNQDTGEAVARYEQAVALDPDNELYWTRLASAAQLAAQRSSDADEREHFLARAKQAFEHALELVPANAYNHNNLGRLLGEFGGRDIASPDRAYHEFELALGMDPRNAYFLSDAAQTAITHGDLPKAADYAGRAEDLYPDFALARAQLGYIALMQGRGAEAVRLLRRALACDWHGDEHAQLTAVAALAAGLLMTGQYLEAWGLAQQVSERLPDWVQPRLTVAQTLEHLGRRAQAIEAYKQVLARDPGHAVARAALTRFGAIRAGTQ